MQYNPQQIILKSLHTKAETNKLLCNRRKHAHQHGTGLSIMIQDYPYQGLANIFKLSDIILTEIIYFGSTEMLT